jgi:hypothetical protein
MKLLRHLGLLGCLLVAQALHAADAPVRVLPPQAYTMSTVCFSDTIATKRPEWIFIIGGTAYRSLDALKERITHLPTGSTLTWDPGCIRIGGEPLTSAEDLQAFEAHCKTHGIRFVRVPSG